MTEQTTTGSIAPYFEQFFEQIKNTHPKIDTELLIRVMLFEINLKKYVGPDIPHVHLDVCLLYTSPSPRDGLLSRMPSSA